MSQSSAIVKALRFSGYGVGDFGMNLYWNSLSLLLLYWYTNVVRIAPSTAGLIFFIATLWDAFSDPIMAAIAERTHSRWGSYRPYLIGGGVILSISFVFLFWAPPVEGIALFALLLIAHLLFRTAYTVVSIPYSALTTRITSDSRDRTLLSGLRMLFAFLGLVAVSMGAFPIVRYFGDGTDVSAVGFTTFAAICGVGAIAAYVIAFSSTRELPIKTPYGAQSIRAQFADMLTFTKRNPAMHTMLAVLFAHSCANLVFGASIAFYVEADQSIGLSKEQILGAKSIATIAMVPVWTLVAHRLGKRRTWALAASISALAGAHLAMLGPVFVQGFVLQIIIIAGCGSGFALLIWSMVPDIIEYGQWKTGIRSESAVYGITSFVQKLAIGLGALAVGVILQFIGYAPDIPFAERVEIGRGVRIVVGLVPAVLWALSIYAVWLHPISLKSHKRAVSGLRSRNGENDDDG